MRLACGHTSWGVGQHCFTFSKFLPQNSNKRMVFGRERQIFL